MTQMKNYKKRKKTHINESATLHNKFSESEKAKVKKKKTGIDLNILEHAIASSINAIGITDMKGKLVYVNDSCVKMWGYNSKEEILGRYLPEFWEGEGIQKTIKALSEKRRRTGVDIGKKKDGSLFSVQFAASVIEDESGQPKYMFGSFIDISEQKNTEQQILLANERLQYLLSSTSAVIYSAEISGDYGATFITDNVTQMTGYKPEDFIEKTNFWISHVHPDDVQIVQNEVPQIFDKDYHTYEYRFRIKNGTYIWMRDEMKLVKDEEGKPLEIIGYWSEITDRKEAEEALQKAHDILEREVEDRTQELTTAIKQMKKEIKERKRAEKELRQSEEKLRRSQTKLQKQALALEQKNIALREIIAQIEIEKRKIKEDIATNVDTVLSPILEGLKNGKTSQKYVQLLEHHLKGLASSFGSRVKENSTRLTPREIEICSMIRGGLKSKDISRLLSISNQTVEKHRKNIRRKFGILNRGINLIAFLRAL